MVLSARLVSCSAAKAVTEGFPRQALTTLRFLEEGHNVLIMGPVGVGKTFMASALGHIACRRRRSVAFHRTDRLLKHLKAARLGATYEAEMRKLIRVDLLILDDVCLHALDATETQDVYEVVVAGDGLRPQPSPRPAAGRRHGDRRVERVPLPGLRFGRGDAG
jgi:IstB-like ATP binding protein